MQESSQQPDGGTRSPLPPALALCVCGRSAAAVPAPRHCACTALCSRAACTVLWIARTRVCRQRALTCLDYARAHLRVQLSRREWASAGCCP